MGVCKSTVSRELRRNATPDGYAPESAQSLCEQRRMTAAKRTVSQSAMECVALALEWTWSPAEITAVVQVIGVSGRP